MVSCQHSGGRLPCHVSVNEKICHTLVSGGVPDVLKPVGVCCEEA